MLNLIKLMRVVYYYYIFSSLLLLFCPFYYSFIFVPMYILVYVQVNLLCRNKEYYYISSIHILVNYCLII